ncbi:MAG: response regulator [Actinobacteria bacterium]|nr:response regulator [Actinomycetota bacterium]
MTKILIVDDDPDMVEAGRIVLEAKGYEVVSAATAPQGLSVLEEANPDLMILDVMMEEPDDGIRMARDVRRKGLDLPIIMLTSVNVAMGLQIDKDEEMVPVDEFVEKPVTPQALVAKVEQLLSARKEA